VVEGLLEVEMWVEEMVVEEEETVAVEEVVDVIVEVGEVGEVIQVAEEDLQVKCHLSKQCL
jgi:hypothetical protein